MQVLVLARFLGREIHRERLVAHRQALVDGCARVVEGHRHVAIHRSGRQTGHRHLANALDRHGKTAVLHDQHQGPLTDARLLITHLDQRVDARSANDRRAIAHAQGKTAGARDQRWGQGVGAVFQLDRNGARRGELRLLEVQRGHRDPALADGC